MAQTKSDRSRPLAVLVAATGDGGELPPALAEACRAVLAHRIARDRGRAREEDGTVVAGFASPLAALRCALRIRHDVAALCERLPEGGPCGWRIGVALAGAGEAEAEAARLADLAEPGGICVSPQVRDAVAGRVFRFKPWTSPGRRRAGLVLAAAAVALAVLALALLQPPNG
jgi:class 3 adenylate cyclase